MEREIGEIFEFGGEWYQCVEDDKENLCLNCDLYDEKHKLCNENLTGNCHIAFRKDSKSVIFKRLEKVGEPFERFIGSNKSIKVQRYRLPYRYVILPKEPIMLLEQNYKNSIEIEIKQNQEDMEEKNLKPFDIQKAREGKPVCTRDGRRARIICHDRQSDHGFPIVALVENTGAEKDEDIRCYRLNGTTAEPSYNLMMLPEKKEGWVNVFNLGNNATYVGNTIFPTEKLAKEAASRMNGVKYIATVKIEWEE